MRNNQVVICAETDAVRSENNTHHRYTICGQKAELMNVTPGGVLKCGAVEGWRRSVGLSGVPTGVGGIKPPSLPPPSRNSEVLTKLSRIPSSLEYTSVTT
jgi:hypothetical protein